MRDLANRGVISKDYYNVFKNRTTIALKNAKRAYYFNMFNSCSGNIKKTWKCINSLIKFWKPQNSIVLKENNLEYHDEQKVSEYFNTYFSNIATELDKNIPVTRKSPIDYMNPPSISSFYAYPTNISEVEKLMTSFQNKSAGFYAIPVVDII